MRIALGIEYSGEHRVGWQKQAGLETVQGALEEALSKVADHPVELHGAGRTDASVHALGQVAHFDTSAHRSERAWVMGANTYLPVGISLHWATAVDDEFHARHAAISRCYQYVIYNYPVRPAILASRVSWYYETLDIELMREAAQFWIGEHDFNSFRSSECESPTAMRNIHHIDIQRFHHFVVIEIQANAFLHHMVRNCVGVLKKIGAGAAEPRWAKEVLDARDRRMAGETAPPFGLYLTKVNYRAPYVFPSPGKIFILGNSLMGF